ncbi:MAG: phosphopantothenoylcysteine decarboxylase, partial [Candidatus Omnitrophica bacterium]|nr:phosphopantothenoylcysteine decarboxylase [Candidatus Omnitrophota bacterium]
MFKEKKILIGVTGSIAAYRICDLIERLKEQEAQIQCVITGAGKRFITQETLRALTGRPVYSELFE